MRVALVTTGGVTSFFKDWPEYLLGRSLVQRGHDVVCYTYREPGSKFLSERTENIDGIRVHRAAFNKTWLSGELAWDIIKEHRPDIVHVHHLRNSISYEAISIFERRHVPVVLSPLGLLHDHYVVKDRDYPLRGEPDFGGLVYTLPQAIGLIARTRKPWRSVQNYMIHSALLRSDKIIAISDHEVELLRRMGVPEEKIEMIPLWIDTEYIQSVEAKRVAEFARPMILYVGQLKYRKGFDILAKAMPEIVRAFPEASFVYVGHNQRNEPALREICRENGTEENLKFLGRVTEEEKIRLFRAADAYVLPTRYEGFGLPLLEAMAAGCPVISSDISVVSEIVQNGENGLLSKLEDSSDLAGAILRVLKDAELRTRLISNGLQTVKAKYREDDLVDQILGVYRKAIVGAEK